MMSALEINPAKSNAAGRLKWCEGKFIKMAAPLSDVEKRALEARDEAVRWTVGLSAAGALLLFALEWGLPRFHNSLAAMLGF